MSWLEKDLQIVRKLDIKYVVMWAATIIEDLDCGNQLLELLTDEEQVLLDEHMQKNPSGHCDDDMTGSYTRMKWNPGQIEDFLDKSARLNRKDSLRQVILKAGHGWDIALERLGLERGSVEKSEDQKEWEDWVKGYYL